VAGTDPLDHRFAGADGAAGAPDGAAAPGSRGIAPDGTPPLGVGDRRGDHPATAGIRVVPSAPLPAPGPRGSEPLSRGRSGGDGAACGRAASPGSRARGTARVTAFHASPSPAGRAATS